MGVQWVFDKDFSFEDKNFADIYRFYTIETPVENMSKRGISLAKYGWNKKSITNALKREIPSLNKNWETITTKENKKRNIWKILHRIFQDYVKKTTSRKR